ncbi:hypothetical protein [Pseudarthrobacter sp. Y6]|uniref:hypothetical protein n=1 Tax=Pseudarthrobacter sp. Y6 TaxID=3418422 RepID=UPI003CE81FC6
MAFAPTADQAKYLQDSRDAAAAAHQGHYPDYPFGTYTHEAYLDTNFNEYFCKHCEDFMGYGPLHPLAGG